MRASFTAIGKARLRAFVEVNLLGTYVPVAL